MRTKYSLLAYFLFATFIAQSQDVYHTVTSLDNGTAHQISYFDEHDALLNSWLYVGDMDHYNFDDYSTYAPGESIESTGTDYFEENIWLPDENGGAQPLDVCFNQHYNKYYIYGGRRLIIVNASNNQVISASTVSDGGFIKATDIYPIMPYQKRLVYNSNTHDVYCITNGGELLEIDGLTNAITKIYEEQDINVNPSHFIYCHPVNNKIYTLLRMQIYSNFEKLVVYNCATALIEKEVTIGRINDFEMNSTGNKIFISTPSGFKALNESNLDVIFSESFSNAGKLEYAALGKIYCDIVTNNTLKVFDENNGYQPQTINLPEGMNMIYNTEHVSGTNFAKVYMVGDSKLAVLNCNTNTIENSFTFPSSFGLTFNQNDLIYCSGYNTSLHQYELRAYDVQNNTLTYSQQNDIGIGFRLDYNSNNNQILCGNFREGFVSVMNSNCSLDFYRHSGGLYFKGCFNNSNNKVYLMQIRLNNSVNYKYKNHVVIIDNETNTVEPALEITNNLQSFSQIIYNEKNNKVFISSESENKLYVIDGVTNSISTITSIGSPQGLLSGSDDIVYVSCPNRVYFIDASNSYVYDPLVLSDCSNGRDMVIDEENHYLYVGYTEKLIKVNIEDIENPVNVPITTIVGGKRNMFLYKSTEINKLIMQLYTHDLLIYDVIEDSYVIPSYIAHKLTFDTFNRRVYTYSSDDQIVNVFDLDGNLVNLLQFPNTQAIDIIFNPVNNKVYIYSRTSSNNEILKCQAIDCHTDELESIINLENSNANYDQSGKLIFAEEGNKLITSNLGFSNASVINCYTDYIPLNNGWRWLSFPRMERYQYEDGPLAPQNVLENVSNFLDVDFTLYDQNGGYLNWFHGSQSWNVFNLDEVFTTFGYKLLTDASEGPSPKLYFKGARLDPNVPVEISGNGTPTWIGYFIEDLQYPWDAFPSTLYNNYLTLIQAQNWTMAKVPGLGWLQTGKVAPIRYGDMVIVKTNLPEPYGFTWNNPGESAEDDPYPDTEYYSWEEEASYTPFFIVTDPTSDIAEIAVMADGECRGATVRLPGDTLVEVDGYLGGLPAGSVIEFETWNGYKSNQVGNRKYQVYNVSKQIKESRKIFTGEADPFYLVSFRESDTDQFTYGVSHPVCYPNPLSNETTITFSVSEQQKVTVEIYSITGIRINTLVDGELSEGAYKINWQGIDNSNNRVSKGVYFCKITTESGTMYSEKLVVTR